MKTLRSTVAVILSVLMLLSVCTVASISASAESSNSIYFVPNETWKGDGARFAAYFFNSNNEDAWTSMTDADADGVYEALIPEGNWEAVIFCRMNPETPENAWANKWNQTGNLTMNSTDNCYKLTAGSWEGEGTWSVFPPQDQPTTQPTTKPAAPVEAGKVIVTTTSNGTDLATAKCDTDNVKLITVTFKLQADKMITNYQGTVNYDSTALELVSFNLSETAGSIYNTKLDNMIKFNGSVVQGLYDFTTAKNFCEITFKAKADCNTNVALDLEELNASTDPDTATLESTFPLVSDSKVVGTYALTSNVTIEKIKEDTIIKPEPQPKVVLKASKINAGSRTRVTVSNAKGKKISYSSSKKDVAKIDKSGIITGLRKGTTKLTIKVGTKVFKKNLTVKNNPAVKNGKKTLKNKATITLKKGQTKKLTITGKASAIKNKVSVKSKKYIKITSSTKQAKVTFKAKKKGTTTLTVKINNVVSYKFKIRVK